MDYTLSDLATQTLLAWLRDGDFLDDHPSDMLDDLVDALSELVDRDDGEERLYLELMGLGHELRASLGRAIRLGMQVPASRAGAKCSRAKTAAARRNGKLGGRPRKKSSGS